MKILEDKYLRYQKDYDVLYNEIELINRGMDNLYSGNANNPKVMEDLHSKNTMKRELYDKMVELWQQIEAKKKVIEAKKQEISSNNIGGRKRKSKKVKKSKRKKTRRKNKKGKKTRTRRR